MGKPVDGARTADPRGGTASFDALASCISFMVDRCPEHAAEVLRRGLYSKEPIVDELVKAGLHERLGAAAMRDILGESPWAGEYTPAECLDLLEQMTDTKKGAEVVSSALALVKDDKTLVSDYLRELRRYIDANLLEGRQLMVSMLSSMSRSGVQINPRFVLKGGSVLGRDLFQCTDGGRHGQPG